MNAAELRALVAVPYHRHLTASRAIGRSAAGGLDLDLLPRRSPYYLPEWRRGLLATRALPVLDTIGRRFGEEVAAAGLAPAQFYLTSAFRTGSHQATLRGSNENAAGGVSSHEYGGSIDITYRRWRAGDQDVSDRRYEAAMGRVLLRLQEEGRVYVLRETGQPCFHVTVRP